MRTELEFASTIFESIEGEEEETNEGIFGKALALFLAEQFQSSGYETKIIPEDWGWLVLLKPIGAPVKHDLWFGCSSYGNDQWLIQISPKKPTLWRWFNKIDVRIEVEKVASLIEQILVQKASATNLRWWSDEESGRN